MNDREKQPDLDPISFDSRLCIGDARDRRGRGWSNSRRVILAVVHRRQRLGKQERRRPTRRFADVLADPRPVGPNRTQAACHRSSGQGVEATTARDRLHGIRDAARTSS